MRNPAIDRRLRQLENTVAAKLSGQLPPELRAWLNDRTDHELELCLTLCGWIAGERPGESTRQQPYPAARNWRREGRRW